MEEGRILRHEIVELEQPDGSTVRFEMISRDMGPFRTDSYDDITTDAPTSTDSDGTQSSEELESSENDFKTASEGFDTDTTGSVTDEFVSSLEAFGIRNISTSTSNISSSSSITSSVGHINEVSSNLSSSQESPILEHNDSGDLGDDEISSSDVSQYDEEN